ncbi:MAG: DUF4144 domain-containing protein [Bacteroidales bacterium]|nr:DUF4144 domain-containing protein [Candidatus Latescibacterota bacterium]
MEPEWPALIVIDSDNGPIWEMIVACKEDWEGNADLCCQGDWEDDTRLIDSQRRVFRLDWLGPAEIRYRIVPTGETISLEQLKMFLLSQFSEGFDTSEYLRLLAQCPPAEWISRSL